MNNDNLNQLQQLSTPRVFRKDEYICYEGQPGDEMYIILKGVVGIYVTSPMGTLTEVANINRGDFFGEMAIFDNLPRSASCIAKEDTVCVAINKEKLSLFFANCPDMAAKVLENMSARIRKLDNELYKNTHYVQNQHVPRFRVPVDYKSHMIKRPYFIPDYIGEYKQACPICKRAVTIPYVKRNILKKRTIDIDGRITYDSCEPMWFDVISCPNCYYTNHYLKFFKVIEANYEKTRVLLKDQHSPIVEGNSLFKSELDRLILKYFQAININEHFNGDDCVLIGGLWMNLYWIAKDVKDEKLVIMAAEKAAEMYKEAIDDNKIADKNDRDSIAVTLACLYKKIGNSELADKYYNLSKDCTDKTVQERVERYKKCYREL